MIAKHENTLGATDRGRYLTVGWNNRLTVVLGLPTLVFAAVALFGSVLSDRAAFIGMVAIGALY